METRQHPTAIKSLSARLMAVILSISIAGTGLIGVTSSGLLWRSVLDKSLESVSEYTARQAAYIDGWLMAQEEYVTALSVELSYIDNYSREGLLPILQSHVEASSRYFNVFVGFLDGTVTVASGATPDYAGGWTSLDRPWHTAALENVGHASVSVPYIDFQTGKLCITASDAITKNGEVVAIAGVDVLNGDLEDIVYNADVGEGSYSFLTDSGGNILIHPNAEYGPRGEAFQSMLEISGGVYASVWNRSTEDGVPVQGVGADGVNRFYTAHTAPTTGWKLYTAIPVNVVRAPIYRTLLVAVLLSIAILLTVCFAIRLTIRKLVVQPIAEVTRAAEHLTDGGTDIEMNRKYDDEIGLLMDSFTRMAKSIHSYVEVTRQIAEGDLTVTVPVRSERDVLGHALQDLCAGVNQILSRVALAVDNVAAGSAQITDSAHELAQGATLQADSIRELSSTVESLAERLHINETKAAATSQMRQDITDSARMGTEQMDHMMQAAQEISEASQSISNIIEIIEDIAFQTNMLALNAAVEAARAGQHGKGFSVVADEVRSLAGRSSQAAKESAALIQDSVAKAMEGSRIARETSQSFHSIIDEIDKNAQLTDDIISITREQAQAISQINREIERVHEVVNANATTAERNAASAQELTAESEHLAHLVEIFKLNAELPPPRPSTPPPKDPAGFGMRL